VKKGQLSEFRRLVERYQRPVYILAFRILGRREAAEDAAQDIFIRVYQSLGTYSDRHAFWPWLRRVAVNCCLKKVDREFPSDEVELMIELDQPTIDPVEVEVLRKVDLNLIDRASTRIPGPYRAIIALRYLEDLSTPEIAEILDVPVGTVRVRLFRAIKLLAEQLAVTENEV
jgi:RNA polymerase sigma-70 factor (ECF subfamily)